MMRGKTLLALLVVALFVSCVSGAHLSRKKMHKMNAAARTAKFMASAKARAAKTMAPLKDRVHLALTNLEGRIYTEMLTNPGLLAKDTFGGAVLAEMRASPATPTINGANVEPVYGPGNVAEDTINDQDLEKFVYDILGPDYEKMKAEEAAAAEAAAEAEAEAEGDGDGEGEEGEEAAGEEGEAGEKATGEEGEAGEEAKLGAEKEGDKEEGDGDDEGDGEGDGDDEGDGDGDGEDEGDGEGDGDDEGDGDGDGDGDGEEGDGEEEAAEEAPAALLQHKHTAEPAAKDVDAAPQLTAAKIESGPAVSDPLKSFVPASFLSAKESKVVMASQQPAPTAFAETSARVGKKHQRMRVMVDEDVDPSIAAEDHMF